MSWEGMVEKSVCLSEITSKHSPFTLSNLASLNLVSIVRCSSPPSHPVSHDTRRVDPSDIAFSLSLHRHSCMSILLPLDLSFHNKQKN